MCTLVQMENFGRTTGHVRISGLVLCSECFSEWGALRVFYVFFMFWALEILALFNNIASGGGGWCILKVFSGTG